MKWGASPTGGRVTFVAPGTPGPEGSVAKLAFAEENQRTSELCVNLMGSEGMLYGSNYPHIRPSESALTGGRYAQGVPAHARELHRGRDE